MSKAFQTVKLNMQVLPRIKDKLDDLKDNQVDTLVRLIASRLKADPAVAKSPVGRALREVSLSFEAFDYWHVSGSAPVSLAIRSLQAALLKHGAKFTPDQGKVVQGTINLATKTLEEVKAEVVMVVAPMVNTEYALDEMTGEARRDFVKGMSTEPNHKALGLLDDAKEALATHDYDEVLFFSSQAEEALNKAGGFDLFDTPVTPPTPEVSKSNNLAAKLGETPMLIASEKVLKPAVLPLVSQKFNYYRGKQAWAIRATVARNEVEALALGKKLLANLIAQKNLTSREPNLKGLPLYVEYGESYVMTPATRTAAVVERYLSTHKALASVACESV